ncbi:hypothetical protein [Bacillus sp. T33-2]|uniref:hypothetical protein n=1 Tax=Bacillus sp. T33-2 TaxID=2054168 RepID=UPI000C76E12C|nr:hypothetical protein [Bacillus sp. T33-2]PLR92568.1 hypothetical protein CVD19_20135 [Bacillus sp. T33-2]
MKNRDDAKVNIDVNSNQNDRELRERISTGLTDAGDTNNELQDVFYSDDHNAREGEPSVAPVIRIPD